MPLCPASAPEEMARPKGHPASWGPVPDGACDQKLRTCRVDEGSSSAPVMRLRGTGTRGGFRSGCKGG